MSKRPFGEIGFSASSGVKLNANSSMVTDSFGDITTTPQGVAGQVLTSQGSGVAPKYTNIAIDASTISGVLAIANGGTSTTAASGTGSVVLNTAPLIHAPNMDNLISVGNPGLVLVEAAGSSTVGYNIPNGTGAIVATDSPTLTGTPQIADARGKTITADTQFRVHRSTGGIAEASVFYGDDNTATNWSVGINTNGTTGGYFNWYNNVMNANIASVSPAGTFSAINLSSLNTTINTIAGFDGANNLKSMTQTGTGLTVVTAVAPTIASLSLTGTTNSTGPIHSTSGFGIDRAASGEASIYYNSIGLTNWIVGTGLGGNSDYTFYNGTSRANLSPSGIFSAGGVKPGLAANTVPYTNGSQLLEASTGGLGTAGQVFTSTGPASAPAWSTPAALADPPTVTTYSEPGTFTYVPPVGMKYARVTVLGGGGAGGACISVADNNAGGGGSGGMAQFVLPVADLVGGNNVTVGAAGTSAATQGTVNVFNGSTTVTGNDTQFKSIFKPGHFFFLGTSYAVASVNSDTSLVLASPFIGATATNTFGCIPPGFMSMSQGSTLVTGSSGTFGPPTFTTTFQVGDTFLLDGFIYEVASITSNILLNTTAIADHLISPQTYFTSAQAGGESRFVTTPLGAVKAFGGKPGDRAIQNATISKSGLGGATLYPPGFSSSKVTARATGSGGSIGYLPQVQPVGALSAPAPGLAGGDTTNYGWNRGQFNTKGGGGVGGLKIGVSTGVNPTFYGSTGGAGMVRIEEFYAT